MAPSVAMQAHHYTPGKTDLSRGWFLSRKFNGFRGIRQPDGLYSLGRYSGSKQIHAPDWWLAKLPATLLDGEIWHESDDLAYVKSIAGQGREKSLRDPRWKELTFQAFDIRPPSGINLFWKTRQMTLNQHADNDVFKKVMQFLVYNHAQVEGLLQEFRDNIGPGLEGVMLADPYGYYEYCRSYSILKHKYTFDAEARVTGYTMGEGKHTGRVGALQVALTWDEKIKSVKGGTDQMVGRFVAFNIGGGLSDPERSYDYYRNNLAGKLVKFTYLGVSRYGVPQSPNFVEVVT